VAPPGCRCGDLRRRRTRRAEGQARGVGAGAGAAAALPAAPAGHAIPQPLLPLWRDHLRVPRRVPDDLHVGVRDAWEVEEPEPRVGGDRRPHAAAGRGERHLDVDAVAVALRRDAHVVDQAEIHDVHRDLRVETGLERRPHLLLEVTARGGGGRRGRLLAERVGIPARDAEEAAVGGDLHRVGAAEGLRDDDVPALLERHGVPAGDLDRLYVARQLGSFHGGILDRPAGWRHRPTGRWWCRAEPLTTGPPPAASLASARHSS